MNATDVICKMRQRQKFLRVIVIGKIKLLNSRKRLEKMRTMAFLMVGRPVT